MALARTFTRIGAPWMRALHTSVGQYESAGGMPSYTYVPPGSSVSDPAYFTLPESNMTPQEQHDKDAKPMDDVRKVPVTKKAVLLKMSARKPELAPQGGGHYVPPGSSMSDPQYSIKDPVYFMDGSKSS